MSRHQTITHSDTRQPCHARLLAQMSSVVCLCLIFALLLLSTGSVAAQTPAPSQTTYASPEEAMKDLIDAAKKQDRNRLDNIFGPDVKELVSQDPVQRTQEFATFTSYVAQKSELVKENDSKYTFNIGMTQHPFPIPIVKSGDKWFFDTKAGMDELLTRRIGENELKTILTARAYAAAQWEYFQDGDWDNDLVQEFAQKFISSPAQKDGLYWPTTSSEDPSPFGPLVVQASFEGYSRRDSQGSMRDAPMPYHGYYLRILKAQGANAPGGRHSYLTNGNMIGGFALVAYPAKYGSSGVMTFIVNQQGRVYQKDLGSNTATLAAAMSEYNPDKTWQLVAEQE